MAIVETHTFRLAAGVDETDFFHVDQRVQTEFMYAQPGFIRRTTTRDDDGEWFVISLWASLEHAEAAEEKAREDEAARALAQLIDGGPPEPRRYATLD